MWEGLAFQWVSGRHLYQHTDRVSCEKRHKKFRQKKCIANKNKQMFAWKRVGLRCWLGLWMYRGDKRIQHINYSFQETKGCGRAWLFSGLAGDICTNTHSVGQRHKNYRLWLLVVCPFFFSFFFRKHKQRLWLLLCFSCHLRRNGPMFFCFFFAFFTFFGWGLRDVPKVDILPYGMPLVVHLCTARSVRRTKIADFIVAIGWGNEPAEADIRTYGLIVLYFGVTPQVQHNFVHMLRGETLLFSKGDLRIYGLIVFVCTCCRTLWQHANLLFE